MDAYHWDGMPREGRGRGPEADVTGRARTQAHVTLLNRNIRSSRNITEKYFDIFTRMLNLIPVVYLV